MTETVFFFSVVPTVAVSPGKLRLSVGFSGRFECSADYHDDGMDDAGLDVERQTVSWSREDGTPIDIKRVCKVTPLFIEPLIWLLGFQILSGTPVVDLLRCLIRYKTTTKVF